MGTFSKYFYVIVIIALLAVCASWLGSIYHMHYRINYCPKTEREVVRCKLEKRDVRAYRWQEQQYSIWDCGKYGHLITFNEEIFKYARDEEDLILVPHMISGTVIAGIYKNKE